MASSVSNVSILIAHRETEQALLPCLMRALVVWERLRGKIEKEDLGLPEHRLIFEAMLKLDEAKLSVSNVQVADRLNRAGHLKAAGG